MVNPAQQDEIVILVKLIFWKGRVSSRPISTLGDDVAFLSNQGFIICFGAIHDQLITTIWHSTTVAGATPKHLVSLECNAHIPPYLHANARHN